MRRALGPTVKVIRQQLSPQERALWFQYARQKLSGLQEAAARPAPRGKNSAITPEDKLLRQYEAMSEEEQAAWRGNILQRAARLLQRSPAGPYGITLGL